MVYILRCADDSLYTGVTVDLERRVNEHNTDNKKGARYTRSRRPVRVVYQEACRSRKEACQREHELKQLTREQKTELVAAYE